MGTLVQHVADLCARMHHTLCNVSLRNKAGEMAAAPRLVKSRYGAWYLPVSLWKRKFKSDVSCLYLFILMQIQEAIFFPTK